MLYTIGYQGLKDGNELVSILEAYQIDVLLDIRSKPYSRKKAFNKKRLEQIMELSGLKYQWVGANLGGFAEIEESAIRDLAEKQKDRAICIMCMEADPMKCHRETEIGKRIREYGVKVHHITKE